MKKPLAVLIVEDIESDALLILRLLSKGGYEVDSTRVETDDELRAALQARSWDIVISDFSLPELDGPRALAIVQASGLDLPFIAVSGTMGEETAVRMMKAGAHDYVMKDNLPRLVPAVERELIQAAVRRERRQAVEALISSEQRFRSFVEQASDIIFTLSTDGFLTYVSPNIKEILGYESNDYLGAWYEDLIHDDDIPGAGVFLHRLITTGDSRDGIEYRVRHNNGEWRWHNLKASALYDADGAITAVLGISRDFSDRKQAEAALAQAKEAAEAANRAKSQFLANMSHELRTPLNAILGFSGLMSRDPTLTPEQLENLAIINRSGEHLLSLINELLDMARIEAGGAVLQARDFDLKRMLDDVTDLFRPRAAAKGLNLHTACDPHVPHFVCGDEGKLRQVLMNLLDNAIKFTEVGWVEITAHAADDANRLAFAVQDTGQGIPTAEQAAIFQPFGQSAAGHRAHEGAGLGLAISSEFVRLMGGKLRVFSSGLPGQGSRFEFDVVLPPAAGPAGSDLSQSPRAIGLEAGQPDYRLLVVEDRPESRKLLADLLRQWGFVVRTAENGREAIQIWQQWQPHLIWMDMRMPIMDGFEAAQHIKSTASERPTVIVAISGSGPSERRDLMLASGCDDFVNKPFRESDITERLIRHLGVRMTYAAPPPSQQAPANANFNGLPSQWRQQVQKAAVAADDTRILRLADEVESQQPAVAAALRNWIDNYDYDAILVALKKAQ